MRIVICDDEDIYIRQITNYIMEYFKKHNLKQPEIIGFTSGEALLKDTGDKDIAFLDVEMRGISGIHTGREIKSQNKNALIFIITSYPEYLDEAMKFRVFRYLTKPIDKDRLFRNLKDAIYVYNTSTVKVMVETKDKVETIYERDIIFVEAKGKGTTVQTVRGQLMSIEQIQHWEETLKRRIRDRRKKLGILQYKLAETLDISNNHMSAIENGRENVSVELLINICHALDVTPDYLLLGSTHSQNVPRDILDQLRLCKPETVKLVKKFVDMMMEIEGQE